MTKQILRLQVLENVVKLRQWAPRPPLVTLGRHTISSRDSFFFRLEKDVKEFQKMWFCYSTGYGRARGLHVALCLLLQSRILSERENLKLEINFYSFILEAMKQRKKAKYNKTRRPRMGKMWSTITGQKHTHERAARIGEEWADEE